MVVAKVTFELPSIDTLPVTEPVRVMVRGVSHAEEVAAFPEILIPQVPEAPEPVREGA